MTSSSSAATQVADIVRAAVAFHRKGQAELAGRLEISQPALSRRLHGHVPFDIGELTIVAEVLGCDLTDLLPKSQQQTTGAVS